MSNIMIIAHGNCPDGFCSAWIAKNFFNNIEEVEPEIYFALYGKEPPDVKDKEVYMLDFSYKRPVLEKMTKDAKYITILDHHASAEKDLKDLCLPNTNITFRMDESGATLTWQYFYADMEMPDIVKYVKDRDLWSWSLPMSREINASISSYPLDFVTWDKIQNKPLNEFIDEGLIILRYKDNIQETIAAQARLIKLPESFGRFTGMEVPVVNVNYFHSSDVLNILIEKHKIQMAIGWSQRKDGIFQYSLRSSKDFDCSEVAKIFGGGGHKQSSGCESKTLLF